MFSYIRRFFTTGSERSVRYKKNTFVLLLLKGLSLLISLLYVPLLLNGMDTENYGIWLTLTSIVTWVHMMDIGLGNGLRNNLASAVANEDYQKGQIYISSAYVALSVYMGALVVVLCVISLFLNWNGILNAPNVDSQDLHLLVLIVFLSYGATFVLSLLNSILSALQLPALSGFVGFIGQFISFIAVWLSVRFFNIHSLLILGSMVSIIPVLVMLFATVFLFHGKFSAYCPHFRLYNKHVVGSILSLGLKFFFIQVLTIVLYQTNNLIIANLISNEAVVEYNVAYKYMGILYTVYMIILAPLWSASTDAYERGDLNWIVNAQKRLMRIGLLFLLGGLLMLAIANPVYKLWLHNDSVTISFWTTFLCMLYVIARMLYGCYGFIINGIGKLHAQMVFTSVLAFLYIPVAIFLGKEFGLYGIIAASVAVNIFNFGWSYFQYNRLVTKTATGFWDR